MEDKEGPRGCVHYMKRTGAPAGGNRYNVAIFNPTTDFPPGAAE